MYGCDFRRINVLFVLGLLLIPLWAYPKCTDVFSDLKTQPISYDDIRLKAASTVEGLDAFFALREDAVEKKGPQELPLAEYREVLGVNVELHPRYDVSQYLQERGLDPKKLKFLDEGIGGGKLFTHPDLPGKIFKIFHYAYQGMVPHFRTNEGHPVPTFEAPKSVPQEWVPHGITLENIQAAISRAKNGSGHRDAARRISTLMHLSLLARQTDLKYVDFARILAIGSHFVVREYYEDSIAENPGSIGALLRKNGLHKDTLLHSAARIIPHEGLFNIVLNLVGEAPSYFTSETLFNQTKGTAWPRLAVIFDLD